LVFDVRFVTDCATEGIAKLRKDFRELIVAVRSVGAREWMFGLILSEEREFL